MQPKIIVHGGAWNIPNEMDIAHKNGVTAALKAGYAVLQKGGSALDAVEKAVNIMEADDTFDAGRGAFLNEIGEIELDAMIMDGRDLGYGAVGAVQNLLNPVSLARKVMEQTEHCFLVGKGAQLFANRMGFETLDPKALLTARELEFYHNIKDQVDFKTHHPFQNEPRDTVGAVAMDAQGNLAAATSTGGTARKMVGRVGDSPMPGAGGYADNELGGVSTTGWGESIMKVLLAKRVCDGMPHLEAMQAAQNGIDFLQRRVGGVGGVIGINTKGEYAFAHNTPKMACAYMEHDVVRVGLKWS